MPRAAVISSPAIRTTATGLAERLRARSRARGVLVIGGFGALWAVVGALLSSTPVWEWLAIALLAAAFGVRALRLLRANPAVDAPLPAEAAERQRRRGRLFLWTSVGEGVGIFLAANIVVNLGHSQWQPAAIMTVVGLHFLPLAAALEYRPHIVTGIVMTAWALAYPWLFAAGAMAAAGPFGAATILFASAAWTLRSVSSVNA